MRPVDGICAVAFLRNGCGGGWHFSTERYSLREKPRNNSARACLHRCELVRRYKCIPVDNGAVYIQTDKGEIFSERFADYPRLRSAQPAQRANFEYDNIGIRWEELDEDLSYKGFMKKKTAITRADL